jgi:N-acetyl sugar amidotransferase
MEKLINSGVNKNCKPFNYDVGIIIDIDSDINVILNLKDTLKNQRILGLTFDHRMHNVNEKNIVKNLIDNIDVDHLMFTIKPSCISILKEIDNFDLEEFKYFSKYVFLIGSASKYKIQSIYIDSINFRNCKYDINNIADFYSELNRYFMMLSDEVLRIKPNYNFIKNFSSLNPSKINFEEIRIFFINKAELNNKKFEFNFVNQIVENEDGLFWIGFDSSFKEVPWNKSYPKTAWNSNLNNIDFGKGIYDDKLKYCNRCCMPESMEGISFDEFGICTPCRSSEEKMHINWEEREEKLNKLINNFRSSEYYDCLLPMSGGKDSMFQAFILTHRYNLNPLAVTHGANWLSLTGRYNLENCLKTFDLDHLIFHSARSVINKVARKSLTEIGDACWHCHIGAGTFSLQTALAWRLNLMIWGESIAERDGRGSYLNQKEASVYYSLEVSAKVKAEDYNDEHISNAELSKWYFPDREDLESSGIRYLHLGDFLFWDEEKQVDFVVDNFNWLNSKVENTFKGYKSNECVMAGVHDYSNFIKRGIGRATIQASDDVRRGLLTREEGFELAKEFDSQRPHALDYYLKITGYSEKEYEEILIQSRKLSKDASKLNR